MSKSTKVRRWGIAAAALLLVAGLGLVLAEGAGKTDLNDKTLVALGESVYAAQCAVCHGRNLEGQPDWRARKPDGRLPAPPHDASGHTWHHSDQQLFELTKYGPGKLVENYQSDMPGFEGTLSDREIWATLAYIKSRWPEEIRRRHAELAKR